MQSIYSRTSLFRLTGGVGQAGPRQDRTGVRFKFGLSREKRDVSLSSLVAATHTHTNTLFMLSSNSLTIYLF